MPAITLGYGLHRDYSAVLENNRNTKRGSSLYFTTVTSSAQQKTAALFVEVCPEFEEKDTLRKF